uniref:Lysosomal protective protein n=1 Tax=Phallusia mammillata TaxID=59560 RepID=A0A6F9D9K9_9ASCI|nr:lysosomal protective protein-like [Phallusia mammillata]
MFSKNVSRSQFKIAFFVTIFALDCGTCNTYTKEMLLLAFVVDFLLLNFAVSAPSDDLISNLPGLTEHATFKQYSGYLDASPTKHFHYWFVESQNNPQKVPLVLWLFGGPGCSSVDGVLSQNGPYRVNDDGKTLRNNLYSWNKIANVLYIESPASVGYSYDDNGDLKTNDDKICSSHYNALKDFFKKFPEFLLHPLYVFGVSYGGVYVPMLCVRIQNGDVKMNLQGMGIGNGVTSVPMIKNSLVFFAYYHGLLGDSQWKTLTSLCCNGTPSKENCDFVTNPKMKCEMMVAKTFQYLLSLGLNTYSLYSECSTGQPTRSKQYEHAMHAIYGTKSIQFNHTIYNKLESTMPCINSTAETSWLNRLDVREALHIKPGLPPWCVCSASVTYVSIYQSMEKQYKELLKDPNFRVLVYNGDVDSVCNFIGDDWFVDSLNVTLVKPQTPWYVNQQLAGFAKTFEQIVFTTIRGAGHMTSEWKPSYTFSMLNKFLKNKPFY